MKNPETLEDALKVIADLRKSQSESSKNSDAKASKAGKGLDTLAMEYSGFFGKNRELIEKLKASSAEWADEIGLSEAQQTAFFRKMVETSAQGDAIQTKSRTERNEVLEKKFFGEKGATELRNKLAENLTDEQKELVEVLGGDPTDLKTLSPRNLVFVEQYKGTTTDATQSSSTDKSGVKPPVERRGGKIAVTIDGKQRLVDPSNQEEKFAALTAVTENGMELRKDPAYASTVEQLRANAAPVEAPAQAS